MNHAADLRRRAALKAALAAHQGGAPAGRTPAFATFDTTQHEGDAA